MINEATIKKYKREMDRADKKAKLAITKAEAAMCKWLDACIKYSDKDLDVTFKKEKTNDISRRFRKRIN
jgi:hypothetical protein